MALLVHPSRFLSYNAGAFVSDGVACLVDPGITADEIASLVDRLGGAEIGFVVLTHADWDHVLGPEHLPPATVVAQEAYLGDLDVDGVRVELGLLEAEAGVVRERPFEPPLPDMTFADETSLAVGHLELRLSHAPGHAASMLTVYEPRAAELWAADVLSDVEIPLVSHDLGAYERTLERIAAHDIRTLVPGHGHATADPAEIARRLEEDRRYLAELRETVETAVASERCLEEAVAVGASTRPRRGPQDEAYHRLNVERAYASLGGESGAAQLRLADARAGASSP